MKRSSAWAAVTIRADTSRAKIRIISAFLGGLSGNVARDQAAAKPALRERTYFPSFHCCGGAQHLSLSQRFLM
jgi:hypothetical protein